MKRKHMIHNSDGAAAVEFAILAPVLFLLLMGIVEFGLILFASSVVENAATMAGRYGITGDNYTEAGDFYKNKGGLSRDDFIKKTVQDLSGGLLDPSKIEIDNRVYPSFAGAQAGNTGAGANFGAGGQAVMYYITYRWKFFTPMVGEFFSKNGGYYDITSAVLVANEEFK